MNEATPKKYKPMAYQIIKGQRTLPEGIITLDQAKMNSKIDYDYEDALLQMYVDAISDEFENYTGSIILEREVTIFITNWEDKIYLPITPVQEVLAITYLNEEGDEVPVDAANFKFFPYEDGNRPKLAFRFKNFPSLVSIDEEDFRIEIKVKAGFPMDAIPADIKKAALLSFSNVETFREDMPIKYNRTIYSLLGSYKKY